jgi:Ca-activated chloride channel family protein
MSFEHPYLLIGLLLLVPLALIEWRGLVRARRSLKLLLGPQPLPGLLSQLLPKRRVAQMGLRLGAVFLLGLGAAGPQWGREAVRRQSQGSDIVFVLDVSSSMEVRDVPPTRMEEAHREAVALLERLQGSRVGVVAFAGDAVRLCPLTLDQAAVRLTLETIGPGAVSEPGSDLGKALRAAMKLLPQGHRDEQAIVLWTDGEDLEGHAREALEELKKGGLRVFVVGVGTPAGDIIPIVDAAGIVVEAKKDEQGAIVRSRLDENLLRELARRTGGAYFTATRSGGEVVRLASSLGSLARSRRGVRLVERPVARFPLLALVASACVATLIGWPRRRVVKRSAALRVAQAARAAKRARGGVTRVESVSTALLLALLFLPRPAGAQSDWARGDAAFKRKDWARAESLYARRAKGKRPPSSLLANLATARAHLQRADSVEQDLSRLTAKPDAAGRMAGYNLGTLLGGRGEYDQALAELRRVLERDPNDADARFNYEWLLRQKEQAARTPDPKQSGQNPEQPPQDPKQKPTPGQGQDDQQQPPQQQQNAPDRSTPAESPPAPGVKQQMSREQAEQLLGSLGDLERIEKQDRRRTRVSRERRGRDW